MVAGQAGNGSDDGRRHADDEPRRLDLQASFLRPYTERLLWDAGIGPGMRVLDAGCGTGDMTLLIADLVGPSGEIVALDRSAGVLATAQRRVAARGLRQVRFVAGDVASIALDGTFDAIVGRLILTQLRDPVAALRHLAAALRPAGIAAFQEYVVLSPALSVPPHPRFDRLADWLAQGLAWDGARPDMGLHLPATFLAAGLPRPEFRLDGVVATAADPAYVGWGVASLRSLLPAVLRSGAATADDVAIDSLAERLLAEQAELGGVVCPILLAGAWVKAPVA